MAALREVAVLLALAAGCTPMTFSNEQSVDFASYPSVSVELGGPDGSERQGQYLASELSAHSGFRRVTRDGREPASAFLAVDLALSVDESLIALLSSDDDELEIRYAADVPASRPAEHYTPPTCAISCSRPTAI